MRIFILLLSLLSSLNLYAQHITLVNNQSLTKKNKSLYFGMAAQGVIQDFSMSVGGCAMYHIIKKKNYNLTIHGELYPSLMYAGFMIGAGGKIGINNHFRLKKNNGIALGIGKNVRSTIYNFSQKRIHIIPLQSNFQIDIAFVSFERESRKKYQSVEGVYLSYSNIKKNDFNYPWKHVFEIGYYSLI